MKGGREECFYNSSAAAVSLSLRILATMSEKWAHQTPSPAGRLSPLLSKERMSVEGGGERSVLMKSRNLISSWFNLVRIIQVNCGNVASQNG